MTTKEVIEKHLGMQSRMITHSKTAYINAHPEMKPIFNAQIGTKEDRIVWRGDLDLIGDSEALMKIADEIQQTLYICREAAFFNEPFTIENMINFAVGKVFPQSKIDFNSERV